MIEKTVILNVSKESRNASDYDHEKISIPSWIVFGVMTRYASSYQKIATLSLTLSVLEVAIC